MPRLARPAWMRVLLINDHVSGSSRAIRSRDVAVSRLHRRRWHSRSSFARHRETRLTDSFVIRHGRQRRRSTLALRAPYRPRSCTHARSSPGGGPPPHGKGSPGRRSIHRRVSVRRHPLRTVGVPPNKAIQPALRASRFACALVPPIVRSSGETSARSFQHGSTTYLAP